MENIILKNDFIKTLSKEFEIRASKNSNYSLRAFARDLDLSPASLSQILNNKKGLSVQKAEKIASKLGLNSKEAELFLLSTKSKCSRSLKERSSADQSLNFLLRGETVQLDPLEFELAHNWYHMAILELIELKDCEHSEEWFSKKLNLNIKIVRKALDRLEKLGHLKFENGIYEARDESTETSYDIPSLAIKKYHEEMLDKAKSSLYHDDVEQREFLSMTLAFSKEETKEAKRAIRDFQKKFAKEFSQKNKKCDSVYQLGVQFFRLDSIN
jgi:uncharacterized protein (TIGR02147 family)